MLRFPPPCMICIWACWSSVFIETMIGVVPKGVVWGIRVVPGVEVSAALYDLHLGLLE